VILGRNVAGYTQADVDKIRAAIVALAAGERIVTVEYDGPPKRSATYQQVDLPALRSLLADAVADVARAAGTRTSSRRAQFNKGFRSSDDNE
jgi:hypothetical protein